MYTFAELPFWPPPDGSVGGPQPDSMNISPEMEIWEDIYVPVSTMCKIV